MSTSTVEQPPTNGPFTHGQLGYLQLPAGDIASSAVFYAGVFGWQTDPGQAGFEGPGLIGQFVDDREPATGAGPVLWIVVNDINQACAGVRDHGGSVLTEPALDGGERWLSSVLDSAGNEIGLVAPAH
jgi:predicted enzyme related to lactoylglutathione lyase